MRHALLKRQGHHLSTKLTRSGVSRLFGFLFGCVLSGGAVYSYLVQEYKTSNDLLTEDIYVRDELCLPPYPQHD